MQTGAPRTVRTLAGQNGALVEVTAPLAKDQPCSAPMGAMYAFATTGSFGGTFVLVIFAARGVPDEVSAAVVQQIAGSIRQL